MNNFKLNSLNGEHTTEPITIVEYFYMYGPGTRTNRKIEFLRRGDDIWAVGWGMKQGKWYKISTIESDQILVEQMPTEDKLKLMLECRHNGTTPEYPRDKTFSELAISEKLNILKLLVPQGSWKISMVCDLRASNPYFEHVEKLSLYREEKIEY